MPKLKHGLYKHPIYRKWTDMKQRCARDPNYTSQGITVCDRWLNDVAAFHADMGDPPKGLTLDRIDGTKGYEPSNCRWATYAEQNRNVRWNRIVEGRVLADIVLETGLTPTALVYRERMGLPITAPHIRDRNTCKAGHEWTEANTYYAVTKRKQGGTRTQRYCRKCRAAHQKQRRTS
jgi:hypothetical protein